MLPSAQNDILLANPKFGALYQDLCHNKLQPDGSTKPDNKVTQEHDQLQKDLHKARTEAYKREIICQGLQDIIVYRGEALPDELRDLALLVAATLSGQVAPDDLFVVEEELARLQCYAADIAALLSKRLAESASTLSVVATVGDESYVAWPDAVAVLGSDVASQRESLRISHSELSDAVRDLQQVHRQTLEASVRVLEQVIHGGVARHSKGQAENLALIADGISKKLTMHHAQLTQLTYTPEIQATLRSTLEALKKNLTGLRIRVREAEEKLEQYQSARGMNSVVKECAELLAETQRVEAEIARLKAGS